ncbi:DNA cytosine methyltransferase [Microbacterium sp. NPDC087665]|uniref:DNA cytosine methyltransferase n=1 Tax=Microbacterium sp. NPDC087665 TaxID=3364194 RepID=UPI00382B4B8B
MSTPIMSLYSGAGGLDLGFALEGFAPILANDIDAQAKANYEAVMSQAGVALTPDHYLVKDLSESFDSLPSCPEAVLIGGPPCQGFSRAGLMNPEDPRSKHVRNFIDAVTAVNPRAFVMENVAALARNLRWRPILDDVVTRAARAGYECAIVVANSRTFGVAQSRERMFLIGVRLEENADLSSLHHPTLTEKIRPVRSALARVPGYKDQPDWQKSPAKIVAANNPVVRVSPFAGMLFNGQGRPLNLEAPSPTLSASLGGNHTPIVDQKWVDDPNEAGRAVRMYHSAIVKSEISAVPTGWRRLTLLEAAEIQSFPLGTQWLKNRSASLRHIGNAVPPLLAAEIARRVRRVLS